MESEIPASSEKDLLTWLEAIGPLPICEEWMYSAIRHCQRNMDFDTLDGHTPARQCGDSIAKIVNALPAFIAARNTRSPDPVLDVEQGVTGENVGASAVPTGLSSSIEPASGLAPSGFDPSREDELAREILARQFEAGGSEGPYSTYADLARRGEGAFPDCSISAVKAGMAYGYAIAMEARQGGDSATGSVHDSAGPKDIAHPLHPLHQRGCT